jgi:hypothetical protein
MCLILSYQEGMVSHLGERRLTFFTTLYVDERKRVGYICGKLIQYTA